MIGRILFADFLGSFVNSVLHVFPLLFRDFEFLNLVRIPDIAIDYNGFHRSATVCFEWSIDTANNT